MRNKALYTTKQKLSIRFRLLLLGGIAGIGLIAFIILAGDLFTSKPTIAAEGKDGARTISTASVRVNEFTSLNSSASSGSTSITVSSSSLNANGRFSSSLSAGDLIMIIQMQGALISTTNNATYGSISDYGSCGRYEFAEVLSVPNSTTISLTAGLRYSYSASSRTQIVRVPRFTELTISGPGSITTDAWNGSTGGIVAIEVANNVIIDGTINVNGLGFRGGVIEQNSNLPGDPSYYRSSDDTRGAAKGEGIAGSSSTYSSGGYCRGAAANAGGGGNSHNAAGGGGANGGDLSSWNGFGNPDTSNPNWIIAWNLESTNFARNVSSGGGRGGYTFSQSSQDPIVLGPGNASWLGDARVNCGGFGGRPLDYSAGRIFMGGGGGAGDSNNGTGTNGANGGGLVYLLVGGSVSGSGTINADGNSAGTTTGPNGRDGSGGGGGGGTVIVYTVNGNTNGININARGGQGGSQDLTATVEAEGTGGGGGGGYIGLSAYTGTVLNVSGGSQGSTNSSPMVNFTPNGGTKGGPGTIAILGPINPYSGSSALPVELLQFDAQYENGKVLVTWSTSSEKNNDYFVVERGKENVFTVIGQLKGAGTSNKKNEYHLYDQNPLQGTSYYRLSQIDFNGERKSFDPVAVTILEEYADLKILKAYPNAFSDEITFSISSGTNAAAMIYIYSADGKKVWSEDVSLFEGVQSITIDPRLPASGTFIASVIIEGQNPASITIQKR